MSALTMFVSSNDACERFAPGWWIAEWLDGAGEWPRPREKITQPPTIERGDIVWSGPYASFSEAKNLLSEQ